MHIFQAGYSVIYNAKNSIFHVRSPFLSLYSRIAKHASLLAISSVVKLTDSFLILPQLSSSFVCSEKTVGQRYSFAAAYSQCTPCHSQRRTTGLRSLHCLQGDRWDGRWWCAGALGPLVLAFTTGKRLERDRRQSRDLLTSLTSLRSGGTESLYYYPTTDVVITVCAGLALCQIPYAGRTCVPT